MLLAHAVDLLELALQARDVPLDHPAVGLELRLALAAAHADAADLARQMLPLPGEPRQQVLQPRELDLGAGLLAAGALVEDLEDQAAAVHDLDIQDLLEVLHLPAREVVVEDHQVRLELGGLGGHFGGLARADEELRVERLPGLNGLADHFDPGGVRQRSELRQMLFGLEDRQAGQRDADQIGAPAPSGAAGQADSFRISCVGAGRTHLFLG